MFTKSHIFQKMKAKWPKSWVSKPTTKLVLSTCWPLTVCHMVAMATGTIVFGYHGNQVIHHLAQIGSLCAVFVCLLMCDERFLGLVLLIKPSVSGCGINTSQSSQTHMDLLFLGCYCTFIIKKSRKKPWETKKKKKKKS